MTSQQRRLVRNSFEAVRDLSGPMAVLFYGRLFELDPSARRMFHIDLAIQARKIVDTVTRAGATVVGPVPLPTEKNVVCVIRSPHKYKDSREHFEMRTHKRLIDIIDPTPKAVDSLMRLDLPADVNIEIKL